MAITWGSGGVFDRLGRMIGIHKGESTNESATKAAQLSAIRDFISNANPITIESTQRGLDNNLQQLVNSMVDDSETVDGNAVTAGAVSFVGDANSRIEDNGTPTLGQVTATQMLLNDDVVRLECTSASRGADSWSVNSMIRGQIPGSARTAVLYPTVTETNFIQSRDLVGYEFTILEPVSAVANDGGAIIGSPTAINLTGAEKGVNCDSSGKVYVDISESGGTYTFRAHKSSGDRTGDTDRVFDFTYTAIGDGKAITAQNSSGLAGTIDIDALATDADIEITLKVDYVVGDYFLIAAAVVADDGEFLSWFRDNLKFPLPVNLAGGETIADTLII